MSMKDYCEQIMTAAEIENRDAWLDARKSSIGGSEAGVIVGLNKWKSPYQLWLEKTGETEPEDISDKEAVHFGTKLEQLVADEFCEREGKKVHRCGLFRSKEYPFMTASFDRLVVGEQAGLECKTANAFAREAWDTGELPPSYYVQCQHYMMVSGLPKWYIACIVGGQHYVCWTIERNEDDIAALRAAETDFWNKVKSHTMPDIDGSESCTQALRNHFKGGLTEPIDLPEKAVGLVKRIDELKDAESDIKQQKTACQNELCKMLGDNEIGLVDIVGFDGNPVRRVVSWKPVKGRTTIDAKRLKKDLPDIFEKYAKTSAASRRFSIK